MDVGQTAERQKCELMRQIAPFAIVQGITGRLPILILSSSNLLWVCVVVNWRGLEGLWGDGAKAYVLIEVRQKTEPWLSVRGKWQLLKTLTCERIVFDWWFKFDSSFKGCARPKYTQRKTQYPKSRTRCSSLLELILRLTRSESNPPENHTEDT